LRQIIVNSTSKNSSCYLYRIPSSLVQVIVLIAMEFSDIARHLHPE
jgi:hypothetical protein